MWILFLILMCGVAQADVYVLTDQNKAVVGLSEQNDMVVPEGFKKDVILNKKISDLTVTTGEEKMYDFNKGVFTLNSQKVTDKNKADQDAIIAAQAKIDNKASALKKLSGLGLTDDEIKALWP